jgi:hypothetical protein
MAGEMAGKKPALPRRIGMAKRRWFFFIVTASLLLTVVLSCGKERPSQPTPVSSPTAVLATPTPLLPTATFTPAPLPSDTPLPTATALPQVQFALDIDETGQLIFPATEFVFGVTRIYVRFVYRDLADVAQVRSVWYLNQNPVVSGTFDWDGEETGAYVMWMEDLNGVGRGQWRWELTAVQRTQGVVDDAPLVSGAFAISGEPRYTQSAWGLSFDPPLTWKTESETDNLVTFSSPDRVGALALRVMSATVDLTGTAALDLVLFETDYPDAEVMATERVTMNGEAAILQQLDYTDQQSGDQALYVVSALHADRAYSLWMLGPAKADTKLRGLLLSTLHSVRFTTEK